MAQWDSIIRSFILRNPELFKGDKGDPGEVSVSSADVDVNGNLTLTLSNGTVLGPWNIKGSKGDKGDKGDDWTVNGVIDLVYPVGSIYISTVFMNPGTLFGEGTWAAFGTGRVLVGLDAGQTEFDTVEKTGGEKTHALSVAELASHAHNIAVSDGPSTNAGYAMYSSPVDVFTLTSTSAGSGAAHNNIQPYIVVYMWKRTA